MNVRTAILTATGLLLPWLSSPETQAQEFPNGDADRAAISPDAKLSSRPVPTSEVPNLADDRSRGVDDDLPADDAAVQPPDGANGATAKRAVLGDGDASRANVDAKKGLATSIAAASAADEVFSLPSGADKTGVSAKAISVPKGSGTTRGMEESFGAELSTGIATFSYPFALPEARGGVTPALSLQYSSASGAGIAGMGWSLSVPFIARQTDKGPPKYLEQVGAFTAEQDHFVFNGGQELVPICVVGDERACRGALEGEVMPAWSKDWQYFRPRVEAAFQRFFWSRDHATWRVQDKDGTTLELGVPLDGSGYTGALERNPDRDSEIYRWYIVRKYDGYGDANPEVGNPAPVNVAVYRYLKDRGSAYPSDVFDTSPAANPTTRDLGSFAHHTRLIYEPRTDPTHSYRAGFRLDQGLRLRRVETASKTFAGGPAGERHRVRRYDLHYEPGVRTSLLSTIELEGRCSGSEEQAPPEGTGPFIEDPLRDGPSSACSGTNPDPDCTCPRLPPVRFGYSHVTPDAEANCSAPTGLDGFEGFDARVREIAESPPHSVDEEQVDFFDFNADALPDILVTASGLYGRDHGLFCNGADGTFDSFGAAKPVGIAAVDNATSSTITFRNPNLAVLDLDGDGIVDLLHMPATQRYSIYAPSGGCGAPRWIGRSVQTASRQNSKIDFGRDAPETRVVDVNFDGLLDVVISTGTEFQTFFSLGRYPGGEGQFGSATRTGPTSATIDNDPVRMCVPWAGEPVRLSDRDTHFADMNGDGIPDIVRLRRGDIRYWPGRGNGVFGTGLRDDCPAGTFGDGRHVSMIASPVFSDINATTLHLDDVNGDGLADLVQNRFDAVDIWLNESGTSWTDRQTLCGTPATPSFSNRVRLLDVNGSGTADIVWGNADHYRYIDLQGGNRPGLLVRIENGLGKSTDLEYSTSTAEMLAAERTGRACDPSSTDDVWSIAWCSRMPIVAHVVKRTTESDNMNAFGRRANVHVTDYSYRDPLYDGRRREFLGFQHVRVRNVGDSNSPTGIAESTFLLGERAADDNTDECSLAVDDNPREALKGLPSVIERRDESGTYLSTEQRTYRLRTLYCGLDGFGVRHAFASSQVSILYDSDAGTVASNSTFRSVVGVEIERASGSITPALRQRVPVRSASGTAEITSTRSVDSFGNALGTVENGCVAGTACGTAAQTALGEAPADEVITTHDTPGRPIGDATGWLWRTLESHVTGSAHLDGTGAPVQRSHTITTYNAQGDATEVRAVLRGSIPLFRFHEVAGSAVAPAPAAASVDGTILVSKAEYDDFGNLTRDTAPNGRCRDVHYDTGTPGYHQIPTSEVVYTGGCGVGALASEAEYDLGLGAPTVITEMTHQRTVSKYDAFGRLAAQSKPDPDGDIETEALPPSLIVEYLQPSDLGTSNYSAIRTRSQDGRGRSSNGYHETWTFHDGLGRALATLTEADQAGTWIVTNRVDYDAKSSVCRKYRSSVFSGTPEAFPRSARANTPYAAQTYDAFGRELATFDIDGTITLVNLYHALSTDHFDAADLDNGPHQGTPAIERRDGHGRSVAASETIHVAGSVEERRTVTRYLPTGEPEVITRVRVGKTDAPIVRFMRYDSLGRMVLNVEPNTSPDFAPDPQLNGSNVRAWRYAYDDAGDLVGTSDARGCGVNFAYDSAGRIVSEDYSPCGADQEPYTLPSTGAAAGPQGVEVLHVYDRVPAFSGLAPPAEIAQENADFSLGRLVATFDRGSASFQSYDALGRTVRSAVRVSRPEPAGALLHQRYAPRWYQRVFQYDSADRETLATTGVTVPELLGASGGSAITTVYSERGTVARVEGSYGELVRRIDRDADGKILELEYGDAASTTSSFSYDERQRLRSLQTYRSRPALWSTPPGNYRPVPEDGQEPTTLQLLLQDQDVSYDVVNNPVEIRDYRNPEEWPAGSKPVTRKMRYDDLYRLTRVDEEYVDGLDDWVSPYVAETSGTEALKDPRRADPSPHVRFDQRILNQTFQYDWLGNTTRTSDDANGFYDRSLGSIQNGTPNSGPYQLKSATLPGANGGSLAALYDAGGNLTRLDVRRNGPCLPDGASCSQRFAYDWDEVGRLVRARRWDLPFQRVGAPAAPLPEERPAADLRHLYDANDERILKSATDDSGIERHTAYVFDSLELRGAKFDGEDYEQTAFTEVGYLSAHGLRLARLVYDEPDVPTVEGIRLHVFFEIDDDLGSTSLVIDKATGELVESATYQAYGAPDSDYRPERWGAFREDYRFTGKEEDVEVGIQYFGKRFYAPLLGRWLSADPLTVHSLESDLNDYAYVSGQPLSDVNPLGLAGEKQTGEKTSAASAASTKITIDPNEPKFKNDKAAKWWRAGYHDYALILEVFGGCLGCHVAKEFDHIPRDGEIDLQRLWQHAQEMRHAREWIDTYLLIGGLLANVEVWRAPSLSIPEVPPSTPRDAPPLSGRMQEAGEIGARFGGRVNTGASTPPPGSPQGTLPINRLNCGLCTAGGASNPQVTSSQAANISGLPEGPLALRQLKLLFKAMGLGSGRYKTFGGGYGQASRYMLRRPVGTRFGVAFQYPGGMNGGHIVYGRRMWFGMIYRDFQTRLALPSLQPPRAPSNTSVFHIFKL